ncbi:MAG: ATP-binding protein [Candidatus Binatia bacterium]
MARFSLRGRTLVGCLFSVPLSLRSYLILLVLVILIPALGFSVVMLVRLAGQERAVLEGRMKDTARALRQTIDKELERTITALQVLGTSEHLDNRNLGAFDELCRRFLPSQLGWQNIILTDPKGQQLVNVLLGSKGLRLPKVIDTETFERVLQQRKPIVQGFTSGAASGWGIGVRVPVISEGKVKYVLSATFKSDAFTEILLEQKLPSEWIGLVVDQDKNIVARTHLPGEFVGKPVGPLMAKANPARLERWIKAVNEGVLWYAAYSRSSISGWSVGLAVPASVFEVPLRKTVWAVTSIGMGLLVVAIFVAMFVGRRISKPIVSLSESAKLLGKGEIPAAVSSSVREVEALRSSIQTAALMIQERSDERDRAETELRKLNAELEARITRRTAELSRANAELRHSINEREELEQQLRHAQKMEAVGTLASGIAHDFNNILALIMGYAAILKENGLEPEERLESVEAIISAGQRGASLVQQLLTFARKTPLSHQTMQVNELVVDLSNIIRETFPKTIRLSLMLDPGLPLIEADANQLQQALLNLCVNARDAMSEGGILSISTGRETGSNLKQWHPEAHPGDYIRISVADTGVGMDEDTQSRVFEPFFTTKEKKGGTGLGLAAVYGIVRNHEGFIDVRSAKGQGTEFRLYLYIPSLAATSMTGTDA